MQQKLTRMSSLRQKQIGLGDQANGRGLMGVSAERPADGASIIDVFDHVLDKGIVIDAWVRVSLVGIDLITLEARVLVASIESYLQHSQAVAQAGGLVAGQRNSGRAIAQSVNTTAQSRVTASDSQRARAERPSSKDSHSLSRRTKQV